MSIIQIHNNLNHEKEKRYKQVHLMIWTWSYKQVVWKNCCNEDIVHFLQGSLKYQHKQCSISGEIPKSHHTCAWFDPQKMDNLMIPVFYQSIVLPHGLGQSTAGVGGPDLHHKDQTFQRGKWRQNVGPQEDENMIFRHDFQKMGDISTWFEMIWCEMMSHHST